MCVCKEFLSVSARRGTSKCECTARVATQTCLWYDICVYLYFKCRYVNLWVCVCIQIGSKCECSQGHKQVHPIGSSLTVKFIFIYIHICVCIYIYIIYRHIQSLPRSSWGWAHWLGQQQGIEILQLLQTNRSSSLPDPGTVVRVEARCFLPHLPGEGCYI